MENVFLIGYMGSGKTTLGKLLAKKLGFAFVDMDDYLEEKHGKTISQLFADYGEEQFRRLEKDCLHELFSLKNTVVGTGGGTPCFFDNMDSINRHGTSIYLKFSPADLLLRLKISGIEKRPLLCGKSDDELLQFISEALKKRESFYLQATHVLSADADEDLLGKMCAVVGS